MSTAFRIAGLLIGALALLHATFPRRFAWRRELARLSPLNRQIFVAHCLFLVLVLCLQAALLLGMPDALLDGSALAHAVCGGLCLFWLLRLIAQWALYDWSLWRGRRFETAVHVAFTGLWAYLAGAFGLGLAYPWK